MVRRADRRISPPPHTSQAFGPSGRTHLCACRQLRGRVHRAGVWITRAALAAGAASRASRTTGTKKTWSSSVADGRDDQPRYSRLRSAGCRVDYLGLIDCGPRSRGRIGLEPRVAPGGRLAVGLPRTACGPHHVMRFPGLFGQPHVVEYGSNRDSSPIVAPTSVDSVDGPRVVPRDRSNMIATHPTDASA